MTTYARINSQIMYFEAGLAEAAIRSDNRNGKSRKAARTNAIGLITNHVRNNKDYNTHKAIYTEVIAKVVDGLLNQIYGKPISSVQDLVDYQTQIRLNLPMF